jgi:cystathionine beta-lyase/cystathionine gamma-synthase
MTPPLEPPRRGPGQTPPSAPVTEPLIDATTFVFESAAALRDYNEGRGDGFLYSRYANPTVIAVESSLAALDVADGALLFSSGMAAVSTLVLGLLRTGDEIICASTVYGGTLHLFQSFLPGLGITTRFVPRQDLTDLANLIGERTRLVWFESPTNPTLRLVDIAAVAAACRSRGVLSVIDNTFASPVNQRPLALGVDLSLQSATKYLNGHSDVTAGVVAGPTSLLAPVELARRQLGTVLDPRAAHALGRALKTLGVRVARQGDTALRVARALEGVPGVARVYHPGLSSHPDHDLAVRQMTGFGAMVCVDLEGGEAAACRAYDRLRVVQRAASLGGVESLCSLPVLTSNWGCTDAQLAAAEVSRGMLRLSIGLEEPTLLIDDLLAALRP